MNLRHHCGILVKNKELINIMTLDNIYEILMAILPAVTSVISCIGVAISILKKFKNLRDEIKDKTDLNEYKEQVKKITEDDKVVINQLIEQNKQLSIEISELVQKIDKIKRG